MPNVGELEETQIIKTLISLKGKTIPSLGTINSIKDFKGVEYDNDISLEDIKKAPSHAKRDVIINDYGVSLKSKSAAPPAIVNHTTREKWLRISKKIGQPLEPLDKMVEKYWRLRETGKISEDVKKSDINCPFGETSEQKDVLEKFISYFLFKGTGTKDSLYPAEFIIEFGDPTLPQTWTLLTKKKAFEALWPNMIFSLRAKKGMPTDYNNLIPAKKKLIAPWVKYIDGNYRGALHIRAK